MSRLLVFCAETRMSLNSTLQLENKKRGAKEGFWRFELLSSVSSLKLETTFKLYHTIIFVRSRSGIPLFCQRKSCEEVPKMLGDLLLMELNFLKHLKHNCLLLN